MRLFHTSDTHLGHQQYHRTDPATGLNQREVDHAAAFLAVVDAAVRERPDVLIHAGDVFDGVRPSNRALATALDGLLRLSHAGVPTVLIAGNHEHPKLRETGSPFRLFEHIDGVHVAYKGRQETFTLGDLHVHAVPQCATQEALREQVAGIEPLPGRNVLVLHGAVHDIEAFRHAEFNEQSLDPAWFDDRFDYVALGHYHGATQVTKRAWYSGAPDRVSIREAGEEKGFLDVRLGDVPEVHFRALPVRPYADLPPLDATGLDGPAVVAAASKSLARVPEGAVARLRVRGLDPSLRGNLDQRAVHAAGAHALHLDLRLEWADEEHYVRGGVELGGLVEEFESFAAQHPIERLDRKRLVGMARDLLAQEVR